MNKKVAVNFRFDGDVAQYLEHLRNEEAVNKTAYLQKLIRADMMANKKTIQAGMESNRLWFSHKQKPACQRVKYRAFSMNTINGIESFKKTQDVVTYLRQLKKEIMFNQAGIVKEAVDLIIHAAAIGNTEDEYIGVIEIVASSGALWKMTIEQCDDLYAEVKTRFKRNRKTFIDAVNEKNKAILEISF